MCWFMTVIWMFVKHRYAPIGNIICVSLCRIIVKLTQFLVSFHQQ